MFLLKFISRFIAWDYKRGSLQHELLCLAYIASLIFIPTNSNGWFSDGETVAFPGGAEVSLHRYNTSLFLTWGEKSPEPKQTALRRFVEERFGADTDLIRDVEMGPRHYRIIPRGLR